MPLLTPQLAAQVVEACTKNAEKLAASLGRAFDGEFVLRPGETGVYDPASGPVSSGGGLVFALKFGPESMLAVLPAAAGIVPEWTKAPDPSGQRKLGTLGQELGVLLAPEPLVADSCETRWTNDLAAALGRCEPSVDATTVSVEIANGESLSRLTLVWPVANAAAAFGDAPSPNGAESSPARAVDPSPQGEEKSQSKVLRGRAPAPRDLRDLPPNVVSALRVKVPVSVNLAGKKVLLSEVIDLGPGSIIMFDKACDAPLEVSVGGQPVATGEAVKVGDRFGVRVQTMILPEETFRPMLPMTGRCQ